MSINIIVVPGSRRKSKEFLKNLYLYELPFILWPDFTIINDKCFQNVIKSLNRNLSICGVAKDGHLIGIVFHINAINAILIINKTFFNPLLIFRKARKWKINLSFT